MLGVEQLGLQGFPWQKWSATGRLDRYEKALAVHFPRESVDGMCTNLAGNAFPATVVLSLLDSALIGLPWKPVKESEKCDHYDAVMEAFRAGL